MEMCARLVGGTNSVLESRNNEKNWSLVIFSFFDVFIAQTIGIILPRGFSVQANVVQITLDIGNCDCYGVQCLS